MDKGKIHEIPVSGTHFWKNAGAFAPVGAPDLENLKNARETDAFGEQFLRFLPPSQTKQTGLNREAVFGPKYCKIRRIRHILTKMYESHTNTTKWDLAEKGYNII